MDEQQKPVNDYENDENQDSRDSRDSQDTDDLPHAPRHQKFDISKLDLKEELVLLKRVAKVVKGGRRFSFSALMVVGDGNGHVGVGFGKANEVPDAISKGVDAAKRDMIRVPMLDTTIPFSVIGKFGAGEVLLKPAARGTGLIAGPAARAVLNLAGVTDVFAKALGSQNQINVVRATFEGLKALELGESVAERRGKSLDELLGKKAAARYRKDRELAETRVVNLEDQASKTQEKTRRGTYSAGGRPTDEEE